MLSRSRDELSPRDGLLRWTAFHLDSQFSQVAGERVPVHLQDSGSPILIAPIFPQHGLDKGPLKFPDRLAIQDVALYHPAHERIQCHGMAPPFLARGEILSRCLHRTRCNRPSSYLKSVA